MWIAPHKPSPTCAAPRKLSGKRLEKAWELARITPPDLDVVSANAVRVFAEAAVGEHGSLRVALLGAADRFESDADKLEASLKTYLQVDEISLPPARELKFE